MKNQLLFLIVFSIALFSCKNNNEVESIVTVKLNPSFLSMSEGNNEPMLTKDNGMAKMRTSVAATDTVVYAIQVYENDAPSYYGLFNDVSKMSLALTASKNYKFKVSAYKVGTGKWMKTLTDTAGTNYFLPNKVPLKNKFIKGDLLKDIDLSSSAILNGQTKNYPEVDAFYATKTLTLTKGTTSVDFTLLRMGFGINFMVDALTSGSMEIYIGNDTLKLNSTKSSAYTIRQFNTSTNSFSNICSNAGTFADSVSITAKWTSVSGTTVTATGKYNFLRNYQKSINIQLNTTNNSISLEGWGNTVTDIDGNVYKTVTIGTQTWMAENLKVTHYRDGTIIPNITDGTQWINLTTGGYCSYNNDLTNYNIYGLLYNWYAVNNSKNIAPVGWHVASDSDWSTLTTYLGGENVAGGKLKEKGTIHWTSPNSGATNESGFSCLPIGSRDCANNGLYYLNAKISDFWTSTEYSSINAWRRSFAYDNTTVYRSYATKSIGQAVRCVKD